MGRKLARGPRVKPGHQASKKLALQRIGKKRLSPTKMQRRRQQAQLEKATGYKIPKLSDVVKNPSRYKVKKRVTKFKPLLEEHRRETYVGSRYDRGREVNSILYHVSFDPVVVGKKPVGETLIVSARSSKRKGGPGGKGSGSDKRTSHKTGTMAAKRYQAKAQAKKGTRGMKSRKEKKKKKKK